MKSFSSRRRGLLLCWFLLAASLATSPVIAQYFGQNKVRYRSFDFKVLKTDHFDIYYYDDSAEIVSEFGRMAERWYQRLSQILTHELSGRQAIILYASHPDFRQTNAIPGEVGEATGGATEILKRRIVMPLAGPLAESDHVLGHELVHAFQFDITGQGTSAVAFQVPGAMRLPLWFVEGMAEYLALGAVDPHTAMWLRDAVIREDLPTIRQMGHPRYFPYRYGQAFWAYVAGVWGDAVIGDMLRVAGRSGDVDFAVSEVLGRTPAALSIEWHEALQEAFQGMAAETNPPDRYGRAVIDRDRAGGRVNVSPSLSPDGRRLVFLSERDLFSIDMYLADAETGEIERRITRTAVDPHFDSLQFVSSAGGWSRDGRRFAFAAVKAGAPVLTVLDANSWRVIREIRLEGLGQAFNPAWSPDGDKIAFAAQVNGVSDLYVYDLQDDMLDRLTRDFFAVLHPAWSPDGARIAFATDRFTSDPQALSFRDYRLALFELETGQISAVNSLARGKHVNPQWSPDGSGLYFLSDADGISNLYFVHLSSGEIRSLTNISTGISGITALSPSVSVAADSGRTAIGVFDGGEYKIRLVEREEFGEGRTPAAFRLRAAALPPHQRKSEALQALLADPSLGLRPADFDRERYRARLSLDYVAQPTVAAGVGGFGAFVAGGSALFWSDMLGDHNLAALFQVYASDTENILRETAALVSYENRKSRWNWGGVAGQIPFVTGSFRRQFTSIDGQPVVIDDEARFLQINREVSGRTSFPFSRAQRVEFLGGYQNLSFTGQTRRRVFSTATGRLISEERRTLDAPDSLHLGTAGAALVYDTSLFGGTSPILGQRYRVEFSNMAGNLQFRNVLADYRRYAMPVRPVTLAGRFLHFGRYGPDSEDFRLRDLFIGFPTLVRGYSPGSFEARECAVGDPDPGTCPVFDRLLGSRVMVANLEVRVPIFGPLGVVRSPSVPPVEVAPFFDAGLAWTAADPPTFRDGTRSPVTSHGLALRANLMGFAVVQLSAARPNHRPLKGWVWEFAFTPGF